MDSICSSPDPEIGSRSVIAAGMNWFSIRLMLRLLLANHKALRVPCGCRKLTDTGIVG